jgi:hypothetical protein
MGRKCGMYGGEEIYAKKFGAETCEKEKTWKTWALTG